MTRIEYDLVCLQEPHLRLPNWIELRDQERIALKKIRNRETLIARRVYILLARDLGVVDALRYANNM